MNSAVTRATRRSFSLLAAARRSAVRAIESHPFQGRSVSRTSAKADWLGEGKRVGKQAALFVPGITVLLGWPYMAKTVFDGHV